MFNCDPIFRTLVILVFNPRSLIALELVVSMLTCYKQRVLLLPYERPVEFKKLSTMFCEESAACFNLQDFKKVRLLT
jgi:hypothetical protein